MEDKKKEEQKDVKKDEKKIKHAEKIKTDIKKSIDLNNIAELLDRNEIRFFFDGVEYRVRKATYKEKQEAYQEQVTRVTELLDKDNMMMEEILIEKYKKKGIDINKITQQMIALETQKKQYQTKLGELLKKQAKDADLKTYRDEIEKIQDEQLTLSLRKTSLLQYSIEHQAMIYVYSYLTYLILEKNESSEKAEKEKTEEKEEKWVKAFNTYEDFINSKEDLVNEASAKATLIIGRI